MANTTHGSSTSSTFRGLTFEFVKPKSPCRQSSRGFSSAPRQLKRRHPGLGVALDSQIGTNHEGFRGVIYRFAYDPVVHESTSSAGMFNDLRFSSSLPCANTSSGGET